MSKKTGFALIHRRVVEVAAADVERSILERSVIIAPSLILVVLGCRAPCSLCSGVGLLVPYLSG